MRKIILFCAALMVVHTSMGQGSDGYPELYRSLSSKRDFEVYRALFQYLQRTTSKEYANANAFYQLGLFMQKRAMESDPIIESNEVQYSITQANTYFSLAKVFLEEKEFKRQIDFYPTVKPAEQKLTMTDVVRDIDERLSDMEEFRKNLDESLSYLVKSVNLYNHCITTFTEINQENNRLNDLYFLVDDRLRDKLNELEEKFDSSLVYLDKLKASLENYPVGGYKINYSLKKIPVYRLYGLNTSNFLSENTLLWDFRSWVDDFNHILDTDIAFLYSSAEEVNSTNAGYFKRLLDMDTRNIASDYKINPLIVNKMLQYDFTSATAALLSYQEAKVNYLYSIADNRAGSDIASFDRFSKSPDAFLSTVWRKQTTDELLKNAKEKANPESVMKYAKFYQMNYDGHSGYTKYLNKETEDNEAVMYHALDTYKDRILKLYIRTGIEKTIIYNGQPIVLQITAPAILGKTEGYYVHSKSPVSDKGMFIAGTHVTNNQNIAFSALVDSVGSVKWLKEFKQANNNNHAMLTAALNDGFAVIVSSPAGSEVRNRMLLLNAANGNTKTTKDLPFLSEPQQLVYDDIAQTFVLAFKGNSLMPFSASSDPLLICMLDAKLETLWGKMLEFDGYLSNVIKTDDNYYVYGSYSRLTDENGKNYLTQSNLTNLFVFPITAGGNWLNVTTFDAPFSYYPLKVVKINNEYVDVISIKNAPPDRVIEERTLTGSPYYTVIHSNSKLYYQYNQ